LLPDFDEIEGALRQAGALGEAAEVHGQLCGLVCLMGRDAGSPWAAETLADSQVPDSAKADSARVLADLAMQSIRALYEGDMSLELLLPSDEQPLDARADSLGHWCQGFLHGLGAVGELENGRTALLEQETIQEILEDFSEISRAGFAEEETEIEAEAAYAELVEYVRVSAQLIFEEMTVVRPDTDAQDNMKNPS
jgi:uncharacterized protein YgfB (UPF0149 family)